MEHISKQIKKPIIKNQVSKAKKEKGVQERKKKVTRVNLYQCST
jgi:hypothetical protein